MDSANSAAEVAIGLSCVWRWCGGRELRRASTIIGAAAAGGAVEKNENCFVDVDAGGVLRQPRTSQRPRK